MKIEDKKINDEVFEKLITTDELFESVEKILKIETDASHKRAKVLSWIIDYLRGIDDITERLSKYSQAKNKIDTIVSLLDDNLQSDLPPGFIDMLVSDLGCKTNNSWTTKQIENIFPKIIRGLLKVANKAANDDGNFWKVTDLFVHIGSIIHSNPEHETTFYKVMGEREYIIEFKKVVNWLINVSSKKEVQWDINYRFRKQEEEFQRDTDVKLPEYEDRVMDFENPLTIWKWNENTPTKALQEVQAEVEALKKKMKL